MEDSSYGYLIFSYALAIKLHNSLSNLPAVITWCNQGELPIKHSNSIILIHIRVYTDLIFLQNKRTIFKSANQFAVIPISHCDFPREEKRNLKI